MRWWACVLLLAFVACGGKAVIDGNAGEGGVGGTTNGPGPGPATSTASAMTSRCQAACAAIALCSTVECQNGCATVEPECEEYRDAFLDCYVAGTDPETCTMPDCDADLVGFLNCEQRIAPVECRGDGHSECSCTGDEGIDSPYETYCVEEGLSSRCQCYRDGEFAGECSAPVYIVDACDPYAGCCAGLLFIP